MQDKKESTLHLFDPLTALVEWQLAEPTIRLALNRPENKLTPDHIREGLERGAYQLWCTIDEDDSSPVYAITELEPHVHGVVVVIKLLGARTGSMQDWISELSGIETWAKSIGAVEIQICGRMGWLKALKPHGYQHQYTVVSKQVYDEVH